MTIIFGGTFNPVHIGHKLIAEYTYDLYKPNKFYIIPNYIPPHKNKDLNNYEFRFSCLEKIFDKRFTVSNIERKLEGKSYTINTLKEIKKEDTDLYLLIGEDSLKSFKNWYKYEEILNNAKLLVYKRNIEPYKTDIPHIMLKCPIIDISSSVIRKRISLAQSIKGYVNDKIEEDIIKEYKISNK